MQGLKACNVELVSKDKTSENEKRLGYSEEYIKVKNRIGELNIRVWNQVRRFTNNYEFPLKRNVECNPISRAFFKMWEILWENEKLIMDDKSVLSIAEAPGGFIQAVDRYDNEVKSIVTMSLINESDDNIPKYSKIITENEKVTILRGENGDIYKKENIKHITKEIGVKVGLITADGGFNESNRFNIKEQLHYRLFLSEIIIAINNQLYGGNFVIKFFDIYTRFSLDLVYILSYYYEEVDIFKPLTSRPTNSEKYLICKRFKKITKQGKKIINKLTEYLDKVDDRSYRILNIEIPDEFVRRTRESNIKMMNNQIRAIKSNIKIIEENCQGGVFVPPYIERNNEKNKWLRKYGLM